ncbi:hypothetical protein S40288_10381 [Stachybotrys chartarum IBT 40288]|nr:hypothetical protein S40288_10381 [Stachybotrys chartarum IBT 40288]
MQQGSLRRGMRREDLFRAIENAPADPSTSIIHQIDLLPAACEQLQNTLLARACLVTWASAGSANNALFGVVWRSWRALVQSEDSEQEKKEPEAVLPGPLYYATKLRLGTVVAALITELRGHDAVIPSFLGSRHVDINSKGRHGRTPLSWAFAAGHEAIVQRLLETHDIDVSSRDENGCTPFIWAAKSADAIVVQTLIEGSAKINAEDRCGVSVIQYAMFNSDAAAERLLVQYGV